MRSKKYSDRNITAQSKNMGQWKDENDVIVNRMVKHDGKVLEEGDRVIIFQRHLIRP